MRIATRLLRALLVPLVVGELYLIGLRVLWFKMHRACGYAVRFPGGSLELNLLRPGASGQPSTEWLVQRLLRTGVSELKWHARRGSYESLATRALGLAAKQLGHHDIAERVLRMLAWAPGRWFWAGVLTNIDVKEAHIERMRSLEPRSEFEASPPYQADEKVEWIRKLAVNEKHLALCLEGRFQEARTEAGSGVRLEEVGDTLAVLGEFQAAREIAMHPDLEEFRRQGIKLVLVIELFRRGRTQEAIEQLAELEPSLTVWDRVQLALGLAGREPWGGYPYPDY